MVVLAHTGYPLTAGGTDVLHHFVGVFLLVAPGTGVVPGVTAFGQTLVVIGPCCVRRWSLARF